MSNFTSPRYFSAYLRRELVPISIAVRCQFSGNAYILLHLQTRIFSPLLVIPIITVDCFFFFLFVFYYYTSIHTLVHTHTEIERGIRSRRFATSLVTPEYLGQSWSTAYLPARITERSRRRTLWNSSTSSCAGSGKIARTSFFDGPPTRTLRVSREFSTLYPEKNRNRQKIRSSVVWIIRSREINR